MPGSLTTPSDQSARVDAPGPVAFRSTHSVGFSGAISFVAQWLAYALPCRRFAPTLADGNARLGADVDRSGRIEARTGLRMMPTFPRSSLSFRTAGFPRYGWKAGISDGAFLKWPERLSLLPTYAPCPPVCIHRSCTSWSNANPAQCRVADSIVHRHEVGSPLPQGSSLLPELCCLGPSSLN
jgi:hypothetical protein